MIGGIVYDLMILGKSIEFSKSSYLIPCVTLKKNLSNSTLLDWLLKKSISSQH
jgi:hypothetical protein